MKKPVAILLLLALLIGSELRAQEDPKQAVEESPAETILGTWEEAGNPRFTFSFRENNKIVKTEDGKQSPPQSFELKVSNTSKGPHTLNIGGRFGAFVRFTGGDHVTFTDQQKVARLFHRRIGPRTWRDKTGQFKIGATFVRVNGDQVVLETRADNVEIAVPLAKLSDVDRQYVQKRLRYAREKTRLDDIIAVNKTIADLRNSRGIKITAFHPPVNVIRIGDLTEVSDLSVYFEKEPPTDVDLQQLLPLNKIHPIESLVSRHGVGGRQITDAGLAHLKAMKSLQLFQISPLPQVTDAGLLHLEGLSELRFLTLDTSAITDAGLERLQGLTNLVTLKLRGTKITDAGLAHLKKIPSLVHLDLNGTAITDAGLEHLKGIPRLSDLDLVGTAISDAGLEHLQQLRNLEDLSFDCSKITKTGLVNLARIPRLKRLQTPEEKMTDIACIQLNEYLPKCSIIGGLDSGEKSARNYIVQAGLGFGTSLSAFKKTYPSVAVTKAVGRELHVATVINSPERSALRPDIVICYFWEGKLFKTSSRYEGDRLGQKGIQKIAHILLSDTTDPVVPFFGAWEGYPAVKQVSKGVGVVTWSFPRVKRFVTSKSAGNEYLTLDVVDTVAEKKAIQRK